MERFQQRASKNKYKKKFVFRYLEYHTRMVVCDDVCVTILVAVALGVAALPRGELAWIDRLVLLREAHLIVRTRSVDEVAQLVDRHWRTGAKSFKIDRNSTVSILWELVERRIVSVNHIRLRHNKMID